MQAKKITRWEYGKILFAAAQARMKETSQIENTEIKVNSNDWEVLYQVLEIAHCIVAGWITDVHHLIYNNALPLLPQILPKLVKELPDFLLTDTNSVLTQIMQEVVKGYKDIFQLLEKTEQCYQVPELFLELARGLTALPDQSLVKEQTKESILAFLRTKNYTDLKVIEHHEQIENILVSSDRDYFDKLGKLISSTGKENHIPEVKNLLQAWNTVVANRNTMLENRTTTVTLTKPIPKTGATMSNTLTTIFDNKYQQIQNYHRNLSELQDQMKQLLGNSSSEETSSIVEDYLALEKTIKKFKHEIDNPLITLATSGTTSGGKSSLVNLLCGAEIIPVAVQEMSAGTVVIDHHPTKRMLKIPSVKDLPADYSGEWSDLSDQEIRERLQKVMDSYRQLREENREPPAPKMEIQYPTRLGLDPNLTGLPKGFRLRIIDLPGLKYVADDHNKQVIREEIKPALCLVTYNSEETDPEKQQRLLEEVVEQIRELRGSPARMLFVLNRIDVFRRDNNWKEQTKNFIDKILDKIRTEVIRALPEYQEQAKELNVQPLSTSPALRAYQALNYADLRVQSLGKIDKDFASLMPDELVDELPRKISKWKENDCKQVAEAVWQSSYGYDFDETLRGHIKNNIPQLLLPHLVKSVTDVGGKALTNAHQIANAHLNVTEQRYQAESDRLDNIGSDLQQLRDKSKKNLLAVLDFSATKKGNNIIDLLHNSSIQLEKNYKLPKDSLIPLHDWSMQIGNTIQEFLGAVEEAILEGNYSSQHPIIVSLPPQERQALSDMLVNLNSSGYGKYAEKGYHFDRVSSDSQKEQLKQMNSSLNKLAEVIAISLVRLLERTTEREAGRIQDALQTFVKQYAYFIGKQAHSLAQNMVGLTMQPSKLNRIDQQLILSFPLTAGFPVHSYVQDAQAGTKQVKDGTKQVKVGTKEVIVGEKRLWYTLWFATENVYENRNVYKTRDKYKTVAVYEKRNYEAATIPSITYIFGSFIEQARACRTEDQFVKWLLNQIGQFMTGIDKYQDNLLKEYRHRLEQARQQATQQKETDVGKWQPVVTKVVVLEKELDKLSKVD